MPAPAQSTEVRRSTPGFAARLAAFGDRVALLDETGAVLSYADLASRADAFAARLGDTPRLLLIEAANEIEAVVAYLGALRGGHPVILAAEGASTRDRRIVDTYAPDAVFARGTGDWTLDLTPPRHDLHEALALLLSTSGSTGATKLVRLAGSAVHANAASIAEYLEIGPDDRAMTTLPIHYSYGLSVLNSHLAAGASVLLTARSVVDAAFWDLATALGVTALAGVPYTYEMFDRAGFEGRVPPTLRTLTQAGGHLPPANVTRYADWARGHGVRFFVMYGQTEATARMAYLPPAELAAHPDCIGVAIPGGRFTLRGDDGPVDADEVPGELVYHGPNVMMGYATGPADLARGAETEALATGDIAVRNADGLYRIVGRMSRFAKPFGLRIDLDEVEAALRRNGWAGVATGDDHLIAVEVTGGTDAAEVAQTLAAHFKLAASVFGVRSVAEHPHLPSGKIDYPAILAAARAEAAAGRGDPPAQVEAAFVAAFGQAPADGDSFAGNGGDSLGYVNFALALEDALGVLPAGWEELSFAELRALAAGPRAAPPRAGWRHVETEVVLRALAVMAVVINHASTLVVGGGASVLLLLVGYNLARFQRVRIARGRVWPMVSSLLTRIILPYYLILLAYLAIKREVDVPALLLVSNFAGRFHVLMEPYWFLEVLLQATVIVALIFSVPALRRAATADPWRFGLGLLAASLLVKVVAAAAWPHAYLQERTPDAIFYLIALGWCLYLARTPGQRLLLLGVTVALACVELSGDAVVPWWTPLPWPADISHDVWLVGAAAILLWMPRITLPGWLQAPLAAIAAASFYIYLVHVVPVHVAVYVLHLDWLPVTLGVSVLLGLAAARLARGFRRGEA